jgi:hypothetical protein
MHTLITPFPLKKSLRVPFQEVSDVDRPISFFPKKLDQDQANYSTIEKECFALLKSDLLFLKVC